MARKTVIGSIRFTKYGTPCKAIKKIDNKHYKRKKERYKYYE